MVSLHIIFGSLPRIFWVVNSVCWRTVSKNTEMQEEKPYYGGPTANHDYQEATREAAGRPNFVWMLSLVFFINDANASTAYRQCCRLLSVLLSHKSDIDSIKQPRIHVKLLAEHVLQNIDARLANAILPADDSLGVKSLEEFEKVFLGDEPSQPNCRGLLFRKDSVIRNVLRQLVQGNRLLLADMFSPEHAT